MDGFMNDDNNGENFQTLYFHDDDDDDNDGQNQMFEQTPVDVNFVEKDQVNFENNNNTSMLTIEKLIKENERLLIEREKYKNEYQKLKTRLQNNNLSQKYLTEFLIKKKLHEQKLTFEREIAKREAFHKEKLNKLKNEFDNILKEQQLKYDNSRREMNQIFRSECNKLKKNMQNKFRTTF